MRLVATAEALDGFPDRGRPRRGGIRELLAVPPYVMRYEVAGDQVVILRIRHGNQRPE